MNDPLDNQAGYWDRHGPGREFGHPLAIPWLTGRLPADAIILDYGCGSGRLLRELADGSLRLVGLDSSSVMIELARAQCPTADLRTITPPIIPFPENTFDAVLLFSVLSSVITDEGQIAIVDEIERVLKPGGLLYVSDAPLQTDERSIARYGRYVEKYQHYGLFELDDGGVMRHLSRDWFFELLSPFRFLERRDVLVTSDTGHRMEACQWLVAKRPSESPRGRPNDVADGMRSANDL